MRPPVSAFSEENLVENPNLAVLANPGISVPETGSQPPGEPANNLACGYESTAIGWFAESGGDRVRTPVVPLSRPAVEGRSP